MKLNTLCIFALLILSSLSSCKNDDDDTFIPVPPRDRTEQQMTDKDSLIGYLETHYYNSSTFATPGNYSTGDIIISELPQDANGNYLDIPNPDQNTLLIDAVDTFSTTFQDTQYDYYILQINEGGGVQPTFTDNIKINYSGNTLDGEVFDSTVNADRALDLVNLIQAWREVIPRFRTAESGPLLNEDGTLSYNNYGFGVMFIPSGLAYFNNPPLGIDIYSNLIFKFELYKSEFIDHDDDGVFSHLEDLNENMSVFDDDTDGDTIPNFADTDDDGDGIFSIFEDIDGDGDPSNDDTNGNGIPNYLDPSSTESTQS